MPKRLSEAKEEEILRAYEQWDPETLSVDELVEELDIAKPTLYLVLGRHNVTPKTARRWSAETEATKAIVPDAMLDRMADNALRVLLEEHSKLTAKVNRLDAAVRLHAERERCSHESKDLLLE